MSGRRPGSPPSGSYRSAGPLVQREREMAAVERLLADACGGTGGALLVEGAAGLGKSRLLAEAEARARASGMQVLRARAMETEREYPFGVALQLIEPYVVAVDRDVRRALFDGAAGLAEPLMGETSLGDGAWERSPFSWLHGLYWLSVNIAERGPLLLCVDDVHWSDGPSLRFLLHLAGRVKDLSIALLTAGRPSDRRGDSEAVANWCVGPAVQRIALEPLSLEGVLEFVRGKAPTAEADFCAICAEVTQGNPFYVQEVLRELDERKLAPTAANSGRLRELGTMLVTRSVLLRLARLGRDATALARALAIFGDGPPLWRVASLARLDLDAAATAVDELTVEELLAPEELLAFTHALIRQSIYQDIPAAQRGRAHGKAARLLAKDGALPELVSAHLLAAQPADDPWVVRMLRRSAGRATARGAPEVAMRHLRRALREPPDAPSRPGVLLELGIAESATGHADAIGHLAAATDLQAEPVGRAKVQRLLARALAGQGRRREAVQVLEDAIDGLQDRGETELTQDLLADYLAHSAFEPGLPQRSFARAEVVLAAEPAGVTPAERRLLAALAMRSAQHAVPTTHTIDMANRAWGEGALLREQGPDGPEWLMTVWALLLAEDHARARCLTVAVIDAARRAGSADAFTTASFFHGWAAWSLGDVLDAQADAEHVIRMGRAGWRRYLVAAHVLHANVLLELGAPDDAERTLDAAEEHERAGMLEISWRLHARGRLALARRQPAVALILFEQAGAFLTQRLSVEHTILPWRHDAALAALALGDRAQARQLIESARVLADTTGAALSQGRALRVLGLLADLDRAVDLLQHAIEKFTAVGAELELAYALADLGSTLRRSGHRTDSRVPLRAALDLSRRLGARVLAGRVREELTMTGARPRRDVRIGPDSLSPSERRVAGLAARGMSNKRIAQELFVTLKTVEYHLHNVYQKLDIPGRAHLLTALAGK